MPKTIGDVWDKLSKDEKLLILDYLNSNYYHSWSQKKKWWTLAELPFAPWTVTRYLVVNVLWAYYNKPGGKTLRHRLNALDKE